METAPQLLAEERLHDERRCPTYVGAPEQTGGVGARGLESATSFD